MKQLINILFLTVAALTTPIHLAVAADSDLSSKQVKDSIDLSLLSESTIQFISLCVATGEGNSLESSRNECEEFLDKKAVQIFNLYSQALSRAKKSNLRDKISDVDDKTYDITADHPAIKSKEAIHEFLDSGEDEEAYLEERKTFVADLKSSISEALEEIDIEDERWRQTKSFAFITNKIKEKLEDVWGKYREGNNSLVEILPVKETLIQFTEPAKQSTFRKYKELAQAYWSTNSQNIKGGAKFGALAGLSVWATLVVKDYFFGIVVPGGPVFDPISGLPVAVGLSSLMFASLGVYMSIDFSKFLSSY